MESIRKWFYKPKRDDTSLLAQFFFADEDLNLIASELDSFDGRKDPERCTTLVNLLRQSQDRVVNVINAIMDVLIPDERTNRDFRVKFPEDVLQENLAGQLWFGAECLAAGSSIMNREAESAAMRPLAKALTKSLENVRNLLREACLRNNTPNGPLRLPNNEFICESLKIFDRIFAEFELRYVSAMVPVKTTQEYELQELIGVLFSETLQRALKMGLLTQEQVDHYDPALMFTIPRLAIVSGLLIYPNGPLYIDQPEEEISEMFRPFKKLLHKIRELLWTLNKRELYMLEKLLCDNEQLSDIKNVSDVNAVTCETANTFNSDLDDFIDRFYNDYPSCKDYVSSFCNTVHKSNTNSSSSDTEVSEDDRWLTSLANEVSEMSKMMDTTLVHSNEATTSTANDTDSLYPDYETISDSSLPPLDNILQETENVSQLDGVITNVIVAQSLLNDLRQNSESYMNSMYTSETGGPPERSVSIEIPSTSTGNNSSGGYLLANTVEHDNIVALSNPDQSPLPRGESLPDRDCLETISAATETLSTLLSSETKTEPKTTESCLCSNHEQIIEKPVYLESPGIDSGISTENTSLDRSPSLDLVADAKKEAIPSKEVESIPCQCNTSAIKNIDINYVEKNSEIENCDIDTSKNDKNIVRKSKKSNSNVRHRHHRGASRLTSRQVHRKRTSTIVATSSTPNSNSDATKHTVNNALNIPQSSTQDNLSVCSSETSTFDSDCADDEEIALAMQAAEIANRNEIRSKFRSTEDLLHRLFVCIAGVADQLQTNYASNLRNILKAVFLINANNSNSLESTTQSNNTTATAIDNLDTDSIEYRALESDVIPNDEFTNDPNILAQEALFDTNVYFHINETDNDNSGNGGGNENEIGRNEPTHSREGPSDINDDRPPIWIPDVQAPKCMSCEANFTVVKRRHHCRNCGKVFCARCSANSVPLPKFGHHKPVRVCNKCFMYHLTPFTI